MRQALWWQASVGQGTDALSTISTYRRGGSRRGTCRGSAERVPRRHTRVIMVMLGNGQRHRGPKRTPRLVTSLPATVTARGMVGAYLRSCQSWRAAAFLRDCTIRRHQEEATDALRGCCGLRGSPTSALS